MQLDQIKSRWKKEKKTKGGGGRNSSKTDGQHIPPFSRKTQMHLRWMKRTRNNFCFFSFLPYTDPGGCTTRFSLSLTLWINQLASKSKKKKWKKRGEPQAQLRLKPLSLASKEENGRRRQEERYQQRSSYSTHPHKYYRIHSKLFGVFVFCFCTNKERSVHDPFIPWFFSIPPHHSSGRCHLSNLIKYDYFRIIIIPISKKANNNKQKL